MEISLKYGECYENFAGKTNGVLWGNDEEWEERLWPGTAPKTRRALFAGG